VKHSDKKETGKRARIKQNAHLEKLKRPASVEPECLSQRDVEGGAVIAKFLPQRLLDLDLIEKGAQRPGATQPLL
jgi:hypothetical protein